VSRPDPDLSAALRRLVAVPVDQLTVPSLLTTLVESAAPLLGAAPEASVTVLRGGSARTVASSGDLAVRLDEVQYRSGNGPCLTSARERRPVHALAGDPGRWPDLAGALREAGCDSVWSSPLPVADPAAGSINLYVRTPGPAVPREVASALVAAASVPVTNAWLYEEAVRTAANLRIALDSRAVIEQAKGILMAQLKIPADSAFDLLARTSNETNTKLRDVAQSVVDTGQIPQ
jgi:hypothetical protein